jgi:hypothetical protein
VRQYEKEYSNENATRIMLIGSQDWLEWRPEAAAPRVHQSEIAAKAIRSMTPLIDNKRWPLPAFFFEHHGKRGRLAACMNFSDDFAGSYSLKAFWTVHPHPSRGLPRVFSCSHLHSCFFLKASRL